MAPAMRIADCGPCLWMIAPIADCGQLIGAPIENWSNANRLSQFQCYRILYFHLTCTNSKSLALRKESGRKVLKSAIIQRQGPQSAIVKVRIFPVCDKGRCGSVRGLRLPC